MSNAMPSEVHSLTVEIGTECIEAACLALNVSTVTADNLLRIILKAIEIHPESKSDILIAGLLLHNDVTGELRDLITEIGQSL